MNENDLARRIVAQLDRSLAELPNSTVRRLETARAAALARVRTADSLAGRSWVDRLLGNRGLRGGLAMRLILPVAIVIASLVSVFALVRIASL